MLTETHFRTSASLSTLPDWNPAMPRALGSDCVGDVNEDRYRRASFQRCVVCGSGSDAWIVASNTSNKWNMFIFRDHV
jgi:hypothetical protein